MFQAIDFHAVNTNLGLDMFELRREMEQPHTPLVGG